MFEVHEFNVEVQRQVDMRLSHSPQALAWGEWPANHRTVLTVYCRDRGRVARLRQTVETVQQLRSCVGTPS
jgi:hypothetical protein